jgi:lipoyl-dependent peroxiredoxin subunit D
MTAWVDALKENSIPDYAKDTKLNIDAVIKRSTLPVEEAEAIALAAAFATGNSKLWTWIHSQLSNRVEADAALTAASLMAQNNIWYPYVEMADDPQLEGLPAQLRMNAISSHGGTTKERFEAYCLSASIIGKCHFCIKSHYDGLRKMGYSVEQLRDIGRIAAVMNSISKVVAN